MVKYRHKWMKHLCMHAAELKQRAHEHKVVDLSKLKQQEAASLNTRRPHRGGGGWYQEGLYRDKAAKEASMYAICRKLEAKSIIYWLQNQSRTYAERPENAAFWMCLRLSAWTRSFCIAASLQTQTETWTVHLGKEASGCSECSRSQRELWNQLRA